MNQIEQAKTTLIGFLESTEQRVLALKGPWGVGKSFFVREFIKAERDHLPRFVSFASVFGLRTLGEVRDTISGSIEPTAAADISAITRKLSQWASKVRPSVFGIGFNIPDVSN